ncbi:hypothetical protein FCR2A7T_07040 [Flavobacterium cauense R2A-7]|nr:hypothetical protein FCR2A7T_07040 [Flavobacterium cauense R2A-7]
MSVADFLLLTFTNIPKRVKEKREFLCKKCEHKLFQKIPSPAIA